MRQGAGARQRRGRTTTGMAGCRRPVPSDRAEVAGGVTSGSGRQSGQNNGPNRSTKEHSENFHRTQTDRRGSAGPLLFLVCPQRQSLCMFIIQVQRAHDDVARVE
jgi:hypothetical protein